MIELKDVLTILGLAIAFGGAMLGSFKWIITRVEARHTEAINLTESRHKEAMSHISQVHTRVNQVKDEYVKRSELDRDFKALEKRLESTERAISDHAAQTNQRLDRMLMLLGKLISSGRYDTADLE